MGFTMGKITGFCSMVYLLVAGTVRPAAAGVFGEATLFDDTDRSAMALATDGRYLYGGAGDWFLVFDLADPLRPRKVGSVRGVGSARQIAVQDGLAYVTSREYGLWIVDARDPAHPRIRSRFDTCELATGVDVAGDVCFCGQRQNGVEFIDVRDPDRPRHIAMRRTEESQSVIYRDGWLYSGEWAKGHVTVFDAHDLSDIREVGLVDLHGYGDGLWLQGDFLYAARGHHSRNRPVVGGRSSAEDIAKAGSPAVGSGMGHGLDIFDVRDPGAPRRIGEVDYPPFYARGLDMWTPRTSGDLLVAAQTHNGLFAVDISDKAHPKVIDRWISPGDRAPEHPSDCVGSVAIGNGAVYAAVMRKGFFVLPCARARFEPVRKGTLPKNAGSRDPYPTDPAAWHMWRPKDVGQVRAVALKGDVAYVACGDAGLYVVEIRPDGAGWRERGRVDGRGQAYDVSVAGDRLYVAEGRSGFGVYDISGRMPAEIARLPRISEGQHLAFWVTAVGGSRLFCSDRRRWTLYDVSALPKFSKVMDCRGGCPGWDKYMADRPVGGRYMAFNNANHGIRWYDVVAGRETQETVRNFTYLLNGQCAFGDDRLLMTRNTSYAFVAPNAGDAADGSSWSFSEFPTCGGARACYGIPRTDGRLVAVTSRIYRRASLFDFSDPLKPVAAGAWSFSGNPGLAAFHGGRVVIPCGYEGLLLQRQGN